MTLDDIVIVDPAGEVVSGHRAPTSEKYLHLAVLDAYEDIAVVIHSHAVHATMFAVATGRSRAASTSSPFTWAATCAAPNTPRAGPPSSASRWSRPSRAAEGADRHPRHGGVGPTLEKALHNTALVERCAQIIWGARSWARSTPCPRRSTRTSPRSTPSCGLRPDLGDGMEDRLAGSASPSMVRTRPTTRWSRWWCTAAGADSGQLPRIDGRAHLHRDPGRRRHGGRGGLRPPRCAR